MSFNCMNVSQIVEKQVIGIGNLRSGGINLILDRRKRKFYKYFLQRQLKFERYGMTAITVNYNCHTHPFHSFRLSAMLLNQGVTAGLELQTDDRINSVTGPI